MAPRAADPTPSATASASASAPEVLIVDYAFSPATVTVPVGTAITWVERDPDIEGTGAHTVVADDKSFSSPVLKTGERFSFTPAKAGDIAYHCGIHNYMTGTISVR